MNILIIGGSKGLGKSIAKKLLKKGHKVFVFSRTKNSKLEKAGAIFILGDLTDIKTLKKNFFILLNYISNLDSIVFTQRYREDENLEKEYILTIKIIQVIIDLALKYLNKYASIVFISSNASKYITDQNANYHILKSSLIQLSKYYAYKLGNKKIRVNCVSPIFYIKKENKIFYKKQNKLKRIIPLKEFIKVKEIVNTIEFLIGKKSKAITGQNIVVDKGISIYSPELMIKKEII